MGGISGRYMTNEASFLSNGRILAATEWILPFGKKRCQSAILIELYAYVEQGPGKENL